jgi:nucleolar protein 9
LTTTTCIPKYRRRLITILLPHLEDLLSDKIGSRISERIWESSDGFTKEKIAKSLLSSSESIRRSQYGRYLWPRMKLDVMQRRPDMWRAEAIGVVHHFAHQKAPATATATAQQEQEKRVEQERKEVEEEKKRKKDDIDELFEGVQDRKKSKKSKSTRE